MTKKITLFLIILLSIAFVPILASAYGDGYTDCERDQIYERNNLGAPTTGLYLRKRACMTDSEIMKVLPEGVEVQIIAYTDGWMKIKDSTGAIGWVGARLMEETTQNTASRRLDSEHFHLNVNPGVDNEARQRMIERTKGYILLQVESHGEAWYIDPVGERRHYMKDGLAAFSIMRNFGLGITNTNLDKLKRGDWGLVNRLKGRIVLQVEEHGEAYYIHPQDGSTHYLANGNEAYRIMRELSLGITNTDLDMISE